MVMHSTLKEALRLVKAEPELLKGLREWHAYDMTLPSAKGNEKEFDEWLDMQLRYSSTVIDGLFGGEQKPKDIVDVLRVDTLGDPLARRISNELKGHYGTSSNGYVEDGRVFASVWISGGNADEVRAEADKVEKAFKDSGYSTERFLDPEFDADVTIYGNIPFREYQKQRKEN